jgi:hypothetical protein
MVEPTRRIPTGSAGRVATIAAFGLVCAWACGGQSGRNDGPATSSTAGAGAAGSGGATGAAGANAGDAGSPSGGSAGASGSSAGSESAGGAPSAGAPAGGMTSAGAPGAGRGAGGSETAGAGATSEAGADAGGMAGAGAASFPECQVAEDCEIAQDCCVCQAAPKGASVGTCRLDCGGSNACVLQGVSVVAACTLGRCTLAASCNAQRVTCESLPPTCAAGEVPSVTEGRCWGPCVVATECPDVTDCAACGDAHCVQFPNVGGTTIRCIARHPECEAGNLCECLSPCGDYSCSEQNGELGCACFGC